MSTPLAPLSAEERAALLEWSDFWGTNPESRGQDLRRLLAERGSLERERDEAREQVRSLTETVDSLNLSNTLLQGHREDAEERCRSLTERLTRAETVEARALQHMDEATAAAHRLSEAVRSLTVERDALKAVIESDTKWENRVRGERDEARDRIYRAREALAELETLADYNPETVTARTKEARAALRAALSEPLGGDA